MAHPVELSVKIDLKLKIERHGEFFSATEQGIGITAYAKDFDAVVKRAEAGVNHLLDEYVKAGEDILAFLDRMGVHYHVRRTVTEDAREEEGIVLLRGVTKEYAYA